MVPIMGFCILSLFAGYAIYFPELFPTHLRSTGHDPSSTHRHRAAQPRSARSAGRSGVELAGITLRRACRIGGGAALLPGIEIGEDALVGAGAVVVEDIPPHTVAMGVPARVVGEVPPGDRA